MLLTVLLIARPLQNQTQIIVKMYAIRTWKRMGLCIHFPLVCPVLRLNHHRERRRKGQRRVFFYFCCSFSARKVDTKTPKLAVAYIDINGGKEKEKTPCKSYCNNPATHHVWYFLFHLFVRALQQRFGLHEDVIHGNARGRGGSASRGAHGSIEVGSALAGVHRSTETGGVLAVVNGSSVYGTIPRDMASGVAFVANLVGVAGRSTLEHQGLVDGSNAIEPFACGKGN